MQARACVQKHSIEMQKKLFFRRNSIKSFAVLSADEGVGRVYWFTKITATAVPETLLVLPEPAKLPHQEQGSSCWKLPMQLYLYTCAEI